MGVLRHTLHWEEPSVFYVKEAIPTLSYLGPVSSHKALLECSYPSHILSQQNTQQIL